MKKTKGNALLVVKTVFWMLLVVVLVAGCTKSYFYVDTYSGEGGTGEASFNANTPWGNTNVIVKNGILMAGPTIPDLYDVGSLKTPDAVEEPDSENLEENTDAEDGTP